MDIPLFPLKTVLFPGGPLPLRIFEARYIDMISERVRENAPFGVVLIREGDEAGPATTHDVGTLAEITDWYQGSDGLLGVTAVGGRRFRLLSSERRGNGLNVGKVELLPEEAAVALPDGYQPLAEILADVIGDLGKLYDSLEHDFDDAGWVANRFLEVLPLDLEQKQVCLESDDPLARLQVVAHLLSDTKQGETG